MTPRARQNRVDFSAVKRAVSLEAVLRHYQGRDCAAIAIHYKAAVRFITASASTPSGLICVRMSSLLRLSGTWQRVGFRGRHGEVLVTGSGTPAPAMVWR
jgi:hypothetical protein